MDTIIAIIAHHLDTLDKDYDVQCLVTYNRYIYLQGVHINCQQ